MSEFLYLKTDLNMARTKRTARTAAGVSVPAALDPVPALAEPADPPSTDHSTVTER